MEDSKAILLTPGGVATVAVYLTLLVVLGWLGKKAQREKSLSDFYLGGRTLGFLVLLTTLYATQYSGNTLIGFAAKAYREGFTFLVSVTFMMGIIAVYLIYAPRLHLLSRRHQFITLSDFIQQRFRFRLFSVLVAISGIIAMGNYITSNLKAIGYAVNVSTGGEISIAQGIIFTAIIIVIYETLGGLRSVAWTDVVQGVILLAGCLVIFAVVMIHFHGFSGLTQAVREARPDFWQAPGWSDCALWFSTLMVISLGIAIYPHAIQRIYAAENPRTLRRAFQVMVFLPLFTTLFMIMVGIVGTSQFPELDQTGSEEITLLMLQKVASNAPAASVVILLFLCAVFAAIMSTIDSALLSISAMITQDLYRPLRPAADQRHLTFVGKLVSWIIMIGVVAAAIYAPQTIWRLIEIKLELLMQIAPALLLGLHWRGMKTQAAFWGFVAGTLVTLCFLVGNILNASIPAKPLGVHAGLLGLGLNVLVLALLQLKPAAGKDLKTSEA